MNLLTKSEIKNLSFSDYKIESMESDIPHRIIKIITSGGYLSIDGGIRLRSCRVIVKNWQSIEINRYQTQTKQWVKLNTDDIEKLIDICEFEYGEQITFIKGFGEKTGQWIEFIFYNATLEIEGS